MRQSLLEKHSLKHAVMVGDRLSDIDAGISNNLFAIGCLYGFGTNKELRNANVTINTFSEIIDIISE